MKKLLSIHTVIDKLGGPIGLRKVTGSNRKQAWHWYARAGMFPAHTQSDIQKALGAKGYVASDKLFAKRQARAA